MDINYQQSQIYLNNVTKFTNYMAQYIGENQRCNYQTFASYDDWYVTSDIDRPKVYTLGGQLIGSQLAEMISAYQTTYRAGVRLMAEKNREMHISYMDRIISGHTVGLDISITNRNLFSFAWHTFIISEEHNAEDENLYMEEDDYTTLHYKIQEVTPIGDDANITFKDDSGDYLNERISIISLDINMAERVSINSADSLTYHGRKPAKIKIKIAVQQIIDKQINVPDNPAGRITLPAIDNERILRKKITDALISKDTSKGAGISIQVFDSVSLNNVYLTSISNGINYKQNYIQYVIEGYANVQVQSTTD